jgi:hypothetical protein
MLLRVHCILEGAAAEHNLELDGETELTTLKVLLEDETGIPMDEQVLVRYTFTCSTQDNGSSPLLPNHLFYYPFSFLKA